jgi:adenylate kinase family enzyme
VPWLSATDELLHRPNRIVIAGTAGSGKSTLARQIADVLDVGYFEIDALYHGPDWTANVDFVRSVSSRIAEPAWVTEWQYTAARDALADRADLMVWLDFPRHIVMLGVTRRTLKRSLLKLELWNGNREPPLRTIVSNRDHIVRWAWRTHAETARRVHASVRQRPNLNTVILHNRQEAEHWVRGPLARSIGNR